MKTARISFLVPALSLGGAERSLVKTANLARQVGHRVQVICFSDRSSANLSRELNEEIQVEYLGGGRTSDPRLWLRLLRILRRSKPNVIFGWSLYANLVACLVGRVFMSSRIVISERVYFPDMFVGSGDRRSLRCRLTLWSIKRLYPVAETITANSLANLRFLSRFIGAHKNYVYLPNVIHWDALSEKVKEPISPPPVLGGPKFLLVGRLDRQKGFDIAIAALAIVRQSRDWCLTIIGDGVERTALEQLARQLNVHDAINWLGKLDNPFAYYKWSDIVLVPSRFEGFPNVLLEAMAVGRAVICSDCKTGPAEITNNGEYGVLVPVGSVEDLAREMIGLGDDQAKIAALGLAAQEHVRATYNPSALAAALQGIL